MCIMITSLLLRPNVAETHWALGQYRSKVASPTGFGVSSSIKRCLKRSHGSVQNVTWRIPLARRGFVLVTYLGMVMWFRGVSAYVFDHLRRIVCERYCVMHKSCAFELYATRSEAGVERRSRSLGFNSCDFFWMASLLKRKFGMPPILFQCRMLDPALWGMCHKFDIQRCLSSLSIISRAGFSSGFMVAWVLFI